ncbi:hypothetical protein ACS0TY_000044 [Phlomoides rotata]
MEARTEVESEIVDVDDIDEVEKESCLVGRLTTISDPRFAGIHLQQYKNSSSRNLLAWEELHDFYQGLYVAEIQNDHFQSVSGIQHSKKYGLRIGLLCNFDGLYMKCFNNSDEGKKYLLWNPSCRVYKEFWCPQPIGDSDSKRTLYGIYYNLEMKDYKVLYMIACKLAATGFHVLVAIT